jgi:hypothetical protein
MFWARRDLKSLITQRAQASCKPLSKSRRQKKDQRVTPRVVMRIIILSIFVHFFFLVAASPTPARNLSLFAPQILSLFLLQIISCFRTYRSYYATNLLFSYCLLLRNIFRSEASHNRALKHVRFCPRPYSLPLASFSVHVHRNP